uniref:Uncharacterized protein n=1 Tax=Tanacetum cinerariifolium TaxID=118510 RepID=A0A6L2KXJ0_TANCI|nr:hypothetical protein [Tanacetum cinerariifolium]
MCSDDANRVTPCDSALAGCDSHVSPTSKRYPWGIIYPTGPKHYQDPKTRHRVKQTNCKCHIPIELYPCRIEKRLVIRDPREDPKGKEGEKIMKRELRVVTESGSNSGFLEYSTSKGEFRERKRAEEEAAKEGIWM